MAPTDAYHGHYLAYHVRYLTGIPRKPLPPGQVVVHNHVRPAGFPNVHAGQSGFRYWRQDFVADRLERCDCPWAPELAEHFRARRLIQP